MFLLRPSIILSVFVTWVVAVRQTTGQGGRGSHGLKGEDLAGSGEDVDNPLKKEEFIKNKEHLLEHLKDHLKIDEDKLDDLSEGEANFIFFKSHDFDNDDKLDGLELYQSILHGLEEFFEELNESNDKSKGTIATAMLKRIALAVDKILIQDDIDHDGYLSYEEFAHARVAADSLTDFEKLKGQG